MTVFLPEAKSSDNLQALAEVSHFGTTDMGHQGHGPWTYRTLQEPELTSELTRLSKAETTGMVDSVSLQPCPTHVAQSQDRYVVEEWEILGKDWLFNGVFDGHLNSKTVDYVMRLLPTRIKTSLQHIQSQSSSVSPTHISAILRDSVIGIDELITSEFLNLFPKRVDQLSQLTDADIDAVFENESTGPGNKERAIRCLGGTTLILSLTDPGSNNLWIASLGDCRAVITENRKGDWHGTQINALHNAENMYEVERMMREHPGEQGLLKDGRILGFLEPTRAIGNIWLKLPKLYASRIFPNVKQEWISPSKFKRYAKYILTPPYVSNIPDVFHQVLPHPPFALILCSDGLSEFECYEGLDHVKIINRWAKLMGQVAALQVPGTNSAMWLLRDALGGEDTQKISENLTVEMEERWMDDTTILVQHCYLK